MIDWIVRSEWSNCMCSWPHAYNRRLAPRGDFAPSILGISGVRNWTLRCSSVWGVGIQEYGFSSLFPRYAIYCSILRKVPKDLLSKLRSRWFSLNVNRLKSKIVIDIFKILVSNLV